jgi:hypothetical protein
LNHNYVQYTINSATIKTMNNALLFYVLLVSLVSIGQAFYLGRGPIAGRQVLKKNLNCLIVGFLKSSSYCNVKQHEQRPKSIFPSFPSAGLKRTASLEATLGAAARHHGLEMQPRAARGNSYDSYDRFNPDQYVKDSQEWNLAMINYLLDMKLHGQDIKQLEKSKEFGGAEIIGNGEDNIICKMEPYNLCYKVDEEGNMHPLGDHRPVRLLRIYK